MSYSWTYLLRRKHPKPIPVAKPKKESKEMDKVCPNCKKQFTTKIKEKKFCTDKCRVDNWMREHPRVGNGGGRANTVPSK